MIILKEGENSMLELRLLNDGDISLVEKWLHKEHVKRWYEIPHLGVTIDNWMSEIKERNNEYKWLTHLIVMWQGKPIGLCQYYKCVNSDEDFGNLPVEGTYGIDYFIGEESFLNKGLGKGMIKVLIDKIFSFPDALRITADIDKDNMASKNTILACGFVLFDVKSSRYVLDKKQLDSLN